VSAEFLLTAPADAAGTFRARADIFCGDVRLSRFYLAIVVAPDAPADPAPARAAAAALPRTAFASYAHADRKRVIERVDSLTTAGIQVFLDCADLAQGSHWESVIVRAVVSKDKFFLFWSPAAARSPWVEREWRTALDARGLDYIEPHALDPPDLCPPPPELQALQFGSLYQRL
jgi:hypothetical protein